MKIEDSLALIASEDDHGVLHAVECLHKQLLEANQYVVDELLKILPDSSPASAEVHTLVEDSTENYDEPLSDAESIRFSRQFLVALVQRDDNSRRLVTHSLEQWRDDEQSVGKVLARGAAVTLLLVAMSTAVTYESGPLKIEKKAWDADQIRAFGEVAGSLIGQLRERGVELPDKLTPSDGMTK